MSKASPFQKPTKKSSRLGWNHCPLGASCKSSNNLVKKCQMKGGILNFFRFSEHEFNGIVDLWLVYKMIALPNDEFEKDFENNRICSRVVLSKGLLLRSRGFSSESWPSE